MKIIDKESFKESCNKHRCLRSTMFNEKTCLKDYKQDQCYTKYVSKLERQHQKLLDKKKVDYNDIEIDTKYEEFKKSVWLRDTGNYDGVSTKNDWKNYCVFWNSILTVEEQKYIIKNFTSSLWLNKKLGIMHIESVGRNPEKKYDIDNVVLVGEYFHSLIDQFKDPVTQKDMTNDERELWLNKLKKYIKGIK